MRHVRPWRLDDWNTCFFPAPAVGPTKSPEETWVPISSRSSSKWYKKFMFFLYSCLHLSTVFDMCYLQASIFFIRAGWGKTFWKSLLLVTEELSLPVYPKRSLGNILSNHQVASGKAAKRARVQVKSMFKNKRTTQTYPNPYHPCMAYWPTCTIKNQLNVSKYTIHGWYG